MAFSAIFCVSPSRLFVFKINNSDVEISMGSWTQLEKCSSIRQISELALLPYFPLHCLKSDSLNMIFVSLTKTFLVPIQYSLHNPWMTRVCTSLILWVQWKVFTILHLDSSYSQSIHEQLPNLTNFWHAS